MRSIETWIGNFIRLKECSRKVCWLLTAWDDGKLGEQEKRQKVVGWKMSDEIWEINIILLFFLKHCKQQHDQNPSKIGNELWWKFLWKENSFFMEI